MVLDVPFGRLAVGRRDGLLAVEWLADGTEPPAFDRQDGAALEILESLHAYFRGDLHAVDAIPIGDGTPFQRRVWSACRRIPPGETRSYLWIARRIGGGHDVCRAIGQALRRNPLPVVVPCHRVVGGSGGLGGYAGRTDGAFAEIKRALLEHESRAAGRLLQCAAPRPKSREEGSS
jgi:methylated-DNA-[protein]-cysteine S-methyltransferase